ncbi:MAG TPA: hypothetical protein VND93_31140, partial [Myxococcales bacterium]|nr:hypothetical protein [Myxococcales bacterium]
MRRGSSLPAALAALIVSAAHAQGTTTAPATGTPGASTGTPAAGGGSSCYFLGPKFGADVLDIGWVNSVSNPGVLPGLRAGLWLANGFLAAEAGLKIQASPSSSYGALSLDVGGLYGLGLGKWGPLDTYGLGGLDVNLQAGVSSGTGYAFPNYGLTL